MNIYHARRFRPSTIIVETTLPKATTDVTLSRRNFNCFSISCYESNIFIFLLNRRDRRYSHGGEGSCERFRKRISTGKTKIKQTICEPNERERDSFFSLLHAIGTWYLMVFCMMSRLNVPESYSVLGGNRTRSADTHEFDNTSREIRRNRGRRIKGPRVRYWLTK